MDFDNAYKHASLESTRHIRLLQIKKHSGEDSYPLVCVVQSFDLDANCPDYSALSYTWGPPLITADCEAEYGPDNNVTVVLERGNEHIGLVSLARNLYEALIHLWQLKSKLELDKPEEIERVLSPWIWVDAVCIDQLNEIEKGQQVAIMNEIYAKARTVIAWLGQDDGTFNDVAEFHVECADEMLAWIRQSDSQQNRVPAGYERVAGGYLIRDIGIRLSERIVRSVARFYFRRRYLLRLWICQELALARSAFILLGKRMIQFEIFAVCGEFLKYNKNIFEIFALSLTAQEEPSESMFGSFANMSALRLVTTDLESPRSMFKGIYGRPGNDREVFCFSLLMALEQCHLHQCSDPRDRIFALLGIAKSSVPPDVVPPLVPNYSVTYEQVRFETASILLNTLPYLGLLGVVNHKRGQSTVRRPSWMPTFGTEHSQKGNLIYWMRVTSLPGRSNPFKASGKFSSPYGISSFTESELKLAGRQVAVVRACFLDVVITERTLAAWVQAHIDMTLFFLETFDLLAQYHRTGDAVHRLMLQTLTHEDLAGDLMEEEIRSFRSWVAGSIAIFRWRQQHNEPITSDENMARLSKKLKDIAGIPEAPVEREVQEWLTEFAGEEVEGATMAKYNRETNRFLSDYMSTCMGRSIFRTADSMGLGPLAIQSDDQVWILVPGGVPYILRPTEDPGRFLFIGEAYLHGAMFGEAVEGMSRDELNDITLI